MGKNDKNSPVKIGNALEHNTRSYNFKVNDSRLFDRDHFSKQSNSIHGPSSKSTALYSLMVVDYDRDPFVPLGYGGGGSAQYDFNVAPQTITMSEPMAVNVQATQDGSHYSEHQGQIFKQITMTGTTGYRPNPIQRRTVSVSEQFEGISDPLTPTQRKELDVKEVTGYQEFFLLRNIFRFYADVKSVSTVASHAVMVYINAKEGEAYIVEPLDFVTDRGLRNKLHFKYRIILKTLKAIKFKRPRIDDPIKNAPTGLDAALIYADRVNDFTNRINAESDRLLNKGISNVGRTLDRLSNFRNAVTGINATVLRAVNFPRQAVSELKGELFALKRDYTETVRDILEAAVDFGQTLGLIKEVELLSLISEGEGLLDQYDSRPEIFAGTEQALTSDPVGLQEEYSKLEDNIILGRGTFGWGSSASANIFDTASFVGYQVGKQETLDDILIKNYGDTKLFKEVVLTNRIRYPYISEMKQAHTLSPGDALLLPSQGLKTTGNQVFLKRSIINEKKRDIYEKQYGTDIKLEKDPVTGLYNIAVGASGDAETVSGLDNLKQTTQLRFEINKGDLNLHPNFGVDDITGSKITPLRVFKFKSSIQGTMLADDRVRDVTDIKFKSIDGNVLKIVVTIVPKGSSDSFDITKRSRR